MLVFLVSNPSRHNFYEHFTWQAAAWLEGQAGIRYPVCPVGRQPDLRGDGLRVGRRRGPAVQRLLPRRPARATADGRRRPGADPVPAAAGPRARPVRCALGPDHRRPDARGADRRRRRLAGLVAARRASARASRIRAAATLFFGLGTVFWYTSMLGTTWYFAHVVAVGLTVLAVAIALRADRRRSTRPSSRIDADPGLPCRWTVAAAPDDAGARD